MKIDIKDCPFEIGDVVYFYKNNYEIEQFKCPFCKGNKTKKTKISGYGYLFNETALTLELKTDAGYVKGYNENDKEPHILNIECNTCNKEGYIHYISKHDNTKYIGRIHSIKRFSSSGWEEFEFSIADLEKEEFYTCLGKDMFFEIDPEDDLNTKQHKSTINLTQSTNYILSK